MGRGFQAGFHGNAPPFKVEQDDESVSLRVLGVKICFVIARRVETRKRRNPDEAISTAVLGIAWPAQWARNDGLYDPPLQDHIIFLLLSNTGSFSKILCGEKMDRSRLGVFPNINSAIYLPTAWHC